MCAPDPTTASTTEHPANADALPRHTTPTWEVELLISGVAVFAMLQLPGWLNQNLSMLLPRLGQGLRMPVQTLSMYAVAASVILAVTFSLHLFLRAHWIARVGMHSVYPNGVRWEKASGGPIMRAVERQLAGDPLAAIERADNRASIVFALGVSLASVLLMLAAVLLLLYLPSYLLTQLLGLNINGDTIFLAIVAVLFVPWSLMLLLDRLIGARLSSRNPLHRVMSAMFRAYARVGLGQATSVMGLLKSHHGQRRVQIFTSVAMISCVLIAAIASMVSQNPNELGNYALFPNLTASNAQRIDAAHYDDQRDPLHDPPVPFVQSAVIKGAYLRLVVPYRPERDIPAQRAHCPDALALNDDAARATALLSCLAQLHALMLDGAPLTSDFAAGSDARTNRPALVAMIDVRALAPGRHELRVSNTRNLAEPWKGLPVVVVHSNQNNARSDAQLGTDNHSQPHFDSIAFWR